MAKIVERTLSYCRSNAYLAIGICLGLSLSLLFAPIDSNDCGDLASTDAAWYSSSSGASTDEYEPKINLEGKPLKAQKVRKAFARPRYYSTELGIREKLFVGVLTGREFLHSRGIAINETLAHLVDRVRYFISVPEGTKPNVTLPGIVGFADTRSILEPFHVMKYITDNYLEDYDYYYIVKDTSYVNGRRLVELVEKISSSRDVHLGIASDKLNHCSLDAGILLSNSVVKQLKTSLDWCVKNAYSSSDDVNFGRCILHASKISCRNEIQGREFRAYELPTVFDFDEDFGQLAQGERFEDFITIYPIFDHRLVYKMNAYFAATELRRVQSEIQSIRRSIRESAHLAPEKTGNVSWPVGNEPGNRPLGRFDLLPWIYFNESHTFMDGEAVSVVRETVPSGKIDAERAVKGAAARIEAEYQGEIRYERMINGYWKFDASRGVDYLLDLEFSRIPSGQRISKRIQVCKPLGKAEILPVPYVTENSRVNMILPVDSLNQEDALNFLTSYETMCMQKRDKTFLMLVLLYDAGAPSRGTVDAFYRAKQRALELTDKYKKDDSKVTWLSIRLPVGSSSVGIRPLDPMLGIAIADLAAKKFTPESLLLFVESRMDVKTEYLNRVRMNTISQWQMYSPIPFVEYHPDVAALDNTKRSSPGEFDVNRNAGRYDEFHYDSVSFYGKDYIAMRRRVTNEIPLVRTDKDIAQLFGNSSNRNVVDSIFQLFVAFSDLHAFRAVEPALKIRYADVNCDSARNDHLRESCQRTRNLHLGHRGQLAKLILDYQRNR